MPRMGGYPPAQADIATHAANASAHYTKYTDAEAVVAAKTVKLDDLAAPDDNTDLDSLTTKHGLLPKLDGVITNFLRGDGTWGAGGGGLTLTVAETEVYSGAGVVSFTDLDLSSVIGANSALVLLKIYNPYSETQGFGVRRNGETELANIYAGQSPASVTLAGTSFGMVLVTTDSAGVIEWRCESTQATVTIDVIAYIK